MTRFKKDPAAQQALSQTIKLADVKAEDYDTIFYVGGHGPMWDLVDNPVSIALIESFYNSGKPVAAVCHSPGVFRKVTYKGEPLVKGKHVTGFTNGEEEAVQLTHVVPFLVEDELLQRGAVFRRRPPLGAVFDRRWPARYRAEPRIVDLGGSGASETHDGIGIGVVNGQRANRAEEL